MLGSLLAGAAGAAFLLASAWIALRLFGSPILAPPHPAVRTAARPSRHDCTVPGDVATLSGLSGATRGGVYRGRTARLPAGTTVTLTSTLIVVVDQLLEVAGTITVSPNPVAGRPVDIVLVSLRSDVVVTGSIGSPMMGPPISAPAGAPATVAGRTAVAAGAPGTNAGLIKLVAVQGSVIVDGGWVRPMTGGEGGSATATGQAGFLPWHGLAYAAAAGGGHGGDVRLCALEAVRVGPGGFVGGGQGGGGGLAKAVARDGGEAWAEGGPSGRGGTVWIEGLGPDPTLQVFNAGRVMGGFVQFGNTATATGGPGGPFDPGGEARAVGGKGGHGGTVIFDNCTVPQVGTVAAVMGGGGGRADATGGTGATAPFRGHPGGDAKARGGDGGPPGATPQIPLVGGGTGTGTLVNPPGPGPGFVYGAGGNASALAGNGGPGGRWGGGPSGAEDARGGTGSSGTPATPATAGPVAGAAGRGGAGGVAVGSSSAGTP